MLPPIGNCRGCRLRQRELDHLRQESAQWKSEVRQLRRRVTLLKKDNRRLRKQLDEARRQPHRQAGHFRRNKLKERKKKPGRKRGHQGEVRPTPPPERIDRTINVPCGVCPDCNVPLVDPKIVVQYQTDLPPSFPSSPSSTSKPAFVRAVASAGKVAMTSKLPTPPEPQATPLGPSS